MSTETEPETTTTAQAAEAGKADRADASGTAPRASRGGSGRPLRRRIAWTGRWLWSQLTSMRTALVLLFALALAAIPGSIFPQRSIDATKVTNYLAEHPKLGPVLDKLDLFGVYGSPWFSAVYLLLFVSLVGCIVPRVAVYAKAVRAQPPLTPRRLSRLPGHATERSAEPVETLLDRAEAALRARRYRVRRLPDSVSAERGYLREAGNLVFHVSLVVLLVSVAVGNLFGFRGTSVVVAGQGFSNTLTQYDDFTAGAAFRTPGLTPFTITLNDFATDYETGPVQTGAARLFRADVTVVDEPGGTPYDTTIEVNHPLVINGAKISLVDHGYAPLVTVRDGNGNIAYSGPVVFLPLDGNLTSYGVIKVPDARPQRLAFEAYFLPTGVATGERARSVFPAALNPLLVTNVWSGDPKADTATPESVYTLDTTGLTPSFTSDGTTIANYVMAPGQTTTLPDGLGTITFDGYRQWVRLQVSSTPGLPVGMGAVLFAVAGLCLSLFIRPRRLWVRAAAEASPKGAGSKAKGKRGNVIEVAGLDRADARSGLRDEIDALAAAVLAREHPPDQQANRTGPSRKEST